MRFSLLSIMLATAFAALVVSSLIAPSAIWHQIAVSLTLLSLLVSLVVAFAVQDLRRVFCVGYSIGCGCLFSLLVLELPKLQGTLLTNVPNRWVEGQLNRQGGWDIEVVVADDVQVLKPSYEKLPADSNSQAIVTFVEESTPNDAGAVLMSATKRYSRIPSEVYYAMLDCWWSMAVGIAMGLLAVILRRRSSSPA